MNTNTKFLQAVGEYCNGKKWLKLKVYIVNYKGESTWQAVSDDQYFKFFILRSAVITIQKVRGTMSSFVQVQRGRRDNTILPRQTRVLSFQNDHFLYFLTIKAVWFEE